MTHVSRPYGNWKVAMVKVAFTTCLWGLPIFFDKHLFFLVLQAVHTHTRDVGGLPVCPFT
jgi:hypothetical protein